MRVGITYEWRGDFDNDELNALHAEAFQTRIFDAEEWNWEQLVAKHSLGWVVARDDGRLVGFVNVVWDGLAHTWLQDTMVAINARGSRIGVEIVSCARDHARAAGCEWLHVDYDADLAPFYIGACGFSPTSAGLIRLA